jgi:hypothetical protein
MKVTLNENQLLPIREAFQDSFSFETLSSIGLNTNIRKGNNMRYDYCVKHLGEPVGEGSSRAVFTLSDSHVLKLAFNNPYAMRASDMAGIEQNKREYNLYKEIDSPLLPKILYCDKNYFYMVCESVVPAEEIDFEKFLGIPFYRVWKQASIKEPAYDIVAGKIKNGDKTVGFDKYFDNLKNNIEVYNDETVYDILNYIDANYVNDEPMYDENIEEIIRNSKWLTDLVDFVESTGTSDFCNLENFGIVNRDGNPMIVILDTGLDLDIWEDIFT